MTIEEIRNNAPINAQFYINGEQVGYFMAIYGRWYEWKKRKVGFCKYFSCAANPR